MGTPVEPLEPGRDENHVFLRHRGHVAEQWGDGLTFALDLLVREWKLTQISERSQIARFDVRGVKGRTVIRGLRVGQFQVQCQTVSLQRFEVAERGAFRAPRSRMLCMSNRSFRHADACECLPEAL